MGKRIDIEVLKSSKYGKLTVVDEAEPKQCGDRLRRQLKCLCDCGNETVVLIGTLRSGHTRSCGCGHKEVPRRLHGLSKGNLRKFYMSWYDMKSRCDDKDKPEFEHYGGRGITYPESWKEISGFASDMLDGWEEGLTLERIDVNGNYCKENCTWATMSTQLHNRRKQKNTTSKYIGVSKNKQTGKWVAMIEQKDHGRIHLGYFENEEDAARVYNSASLELYGDAPNIV